MFDGRADIATVEAGQVNIHASWPKARFLVYASVGEWTHTPVPADVITMEQLESFVDQTAAARKMASPFPFLVRGTPELLSYHIANMRPGEQLAPGQSRRQAKFILENRPVELLGFYSDRHHGVFTHPGKNIHAHFTSTDGRFSGHVDDLALHAGVLYLPAL